MPRLERDEDGNPILPRWSCSDGFCGADDCPRCYPTSWNRNDEEGEEDDVEEPLDHDDPAPTLGET